MIPWIVLLALIGLLLALAEVMLAGFGVFGTLGALALIASTIIVANAYGTLAFLAAVVVLIVLCAVFVILIRKKKLYNKFILFEKQQAQDFDESSIADLIGKEGTTVTPLRPNGKARFEERQVDVFSEGDFVDRDSRVIVTKINGKNVVVKKMV